MARFMVISYAPSFGAGADVILNCGSHNSMGSSGELLAKTVELMVNVFRRFRPVFKLGSNLMESRKFDGSQGYSSCVTMPYKYPQCTGRVLLLII